MPKQENIKILKGSKPPHIVIGTPGRTLQLAREEHLNLNNLQMFVLDECDKMLSETGKFSFSLTDGLLQTCAPTCSRFSCTARARTNKS